MRPAPRLVLRGVVVAGRPHDQELMHPILEDRRRLALYLLAWLLDRAAAVGRAFDPTPSGRPPRRSCCRCASSTRSSDCRRGTCAARSHSPAQSSVVDAHRRADRSAAATASAIWTALGYVWADALDALGLEPAARRPFYAQQRPLLFVVGALLYWLAAAGHYLLVAFQTSRDAETRAFEQTLLAREAELRALRAQIDPHFIFNSLHSISALTTTDAAAARTMCLLLADFLRDTLAARLEHPHFVCRRVVARGAVPRDRAGAARLAPHVARDSDPHAAECPCRRCCCSRSWKMPSSTASPSSLKEEPSA